MRSILFFAALVMAAGVYVARIADRQAPPTALAAQSKPPPSTNGSNSRSVTLA